MTMKASRVRLGSLAIAVMVVLAGLVLLPVAARTPSSDLWRNMYSTQDVWRVLVNGFASANPDYAVDYLESDRENASVSSRGSDLRLVLSPMPGQLGNDLRFETSIGLLPDGSIKLPKLWTTRISAAYRMLAFKTESVEDMLDEIQGPFWATAVVWFRRPLKEREVEAIWPHAVETVFFPPSARGAEASPITWSATTNCYSRGLQECEQILSNVGQFQRWASSLTRKDQDLLELVGLDSDEIATRAASGLIAGILVTSDVSGIRQLAKKPVIEGAQVVEVTRMWR
ncbi:hypothetical protein ACQPYK_17620 [Streptosporangium sp. CA-135522]|uniref:hypothetical protein n=1 Tax=Streptosporangium sp. CA-135522 TaxID=3240072 RepID=UPI003D8A3FE2